ncbi:MAG: hypothetical protein APF81_25730 [Desulfosporosinus sp. BRH_c37]|nr:MAG: hypothetical protein APF81_25730 [Desulfosporosinus sp. BRH_c37]
MPSINLSKYNQITKQYEKLNKEYEELDDQIENKDYEDSVVYESLLSEIRGVLNYLLEIQGKLDGMLDIVDLKTPEKKQKYESMLKELKQELPKRIRKHNKRIDEENKWSKNGDDYDNWKVGV